MKLPQLEQVETFKSFIMTYELNFRKAVIKDTVILTKFSDTKERNFAETLDSLLEIVASLMHGYDETLEERIAFLKGIECNDYNKLNEQIGEILVKAGISEATGTSDKKKVISKK